MADGHFAVPAAGGGVGGSVESKIKKMWKENGVRVDCLYIDPT